MDDDFSCELDTSGYERCDVEASRLFTRGKAYEIVTSNPYLVTRTEIGVYAFIDTGFSGLVERVNIDTHGSWGSSELNNARVGEESQILMVGLGALKEFSNFLIDYVHQTVVFGGTEPTQGVAIRLSRSFRNFETEMFAPEVLVRGGMLQRFQEKKRMVWGFIDTGNPQTFIMNGALKKELRGFEIDSNCDCNDSLERVGVENAILALKHHNLRVSMGGIELLDHVRIVCDENKSKCSTRGYNVTIRNPSVYPSVAFNIGNDALRKLDFVFFDFANLGLIVLGQVTVGGDVEEKDAPVVRQSVQSNVVREKKSAWKDVLLVGGVAIGILVVVLVINQSIKK
jgi:hypothetical protein